MGGLMHPAVASLIARLGSGDPAPVSGLPGAAGAYVLARLAALHPAPTLVVTPSPESARRLAADLAWFAGPSAPTVPLPFPAWENLPHEFASPLPEVAGARMAALLACREADAPVLVAPVGAVLHRVPPPGVLDAFSLDLRPGAEHDPAGIDGRLAAMGYRPAPQVEMAGQFALRGDILDVFPPGQDDPVRIEWFGDEVDRVRAFDPVSQRSTAPLDRVVVPPATELPDHPELVARAQDRVRRMAGERDLDAATVTLETGRLARTPRTDGIETWAPFFFDAPMPTVADWLGPKARVVLVEAETVRATARGLMRKAATAMADEAARGTLLPEVGEVFVDLDTLIGPRPALSLEPAPGDAPPDGGLWRTAAALGFGPLEGEGTARDAFADRFRRLGELAAGGTATVVCPDGPRARAFGDILGEHGLSHAPPGDPSAPGGVVRLAAGPLSAGFGMDRDAPEVYLTEAEVFGRQPAPPPLPASRLARFISGFSDLKAGDYVVHRQHGIGLYEGLTRLSAGGVEADFLEVSYLGGDRVYVPMDRLDLVQKYAGGDENSPRLDRMGGKTWERTRRRVRKELTELARDLVELAAARELAPGHAFAPEGAAGVEFAASFPYTETPDQMRAIDEARADMERSRPMDRLICGDVGYGKTEVALRAAFKAMLDGLQVVFLVPTTLLARQHYETCRRRFAGYPFHVAQLSRFQGAAEQKQVLQGLEAGTVDLVVATHRLLSKGVRLPNLGLLIVDEEQRFGVAHKERIKQWKTSVDVLTLTATPIPRTLQLSLIGVRDLSIIHTPPPDRRAIQTRVARFDPTLIAEAVERELGRGGQVFFIHNRVKDIGGMARFLGQLVPRARIAVAHGQMPERRLEEVMAGFVAGESDLLLSTSIIEAGLDIPRANTIIIHRADRFGLSELYQLRGRVGRAGVQAYAYLLGPEDGWTGDARDRLMAIQAFTELGSGFRIAARDLEIRGAGSLLGHKQSGQIAAVGIDAYMRLIQEAMAEIRGQALEPEFETEVKLGAPAVIPEDYIADGGVRLSVYKRVAGLSAPEETDALALELADRFGPVPAVVADLLEQARIRVLAHRLRMASLKHLGRGRYSLVFGADNALSEVGLRLLLEQFGPRIRFRSEHAFDIDLRATPAEGGMAALTDLLGQM
jgi:transcription-repair coupling factor (superfamily II helicase)